MTDLAILWDRLSKATGPDRELDREIWRALSGQVIPITEVGGHVHERWISSDNVRWSASDTRFTASIDASRALVEKVLPGAMIELSILAADDAYCALRWSDDEYQKGDGSSPPLAILAALLKALES